mmetsp:Transcript_89554/g.191897  ORF Transcript_89554/g.191897 Transcript_89554/m.191897 type:complete len:235 (+) Transcript_89554:319-1023(+)
MGTRRYHILGWLGCLGWRCRTPGCFGLPCSPQRSRWWTSIFAACRYRPLRGSRHLPSLVDADALGASGSPCATPGTCYPCEAATGRATRGGAPSSGPLRLFSAASRRCHTRRTLPCHGTGAGADDAALVPHRRPGTAAGWWCSAWRGAPPLGAASRRHGAASRSAGHWRQVVAGPAILHFGALHRTLRPQPYALKDPVGAPNQLLRPLGAEPRDEDSLYQQGIRHEHRRTYPSK